jgi:hypothetical protein
MAGEPGPVPGPKKQSTGMPMRKDDSRRGAVGKPLACLALSLMATGCGSLGQTPGLSARSADVSIAFESIDGPPRETSQMLVRDIDEEAAALRIAVVPTGGEASYRLRGYLAAHAQGAIDRLGMGRL